MRGTVFARKLSGSDLLIHDSDWDGSTRNAHPAADAARLFAAIARDEVPLADRLREMLAEQTWNEKLSPGLLPGDRFLHKTGDTSDVTHDGGILIDAQGERWVVVAYTGLASTDEHNARFAPFTAEDPAAPMKPQEFALERYFARYEFETRYLLCSSDPESMPVRELLALERGATDGLLDVWLGYTESRGSPELRRAIASLYERTGADGVLVHAGAQEPIFAFMNVALSPGDHVVGAISRVSIALLDRGSGRCRGDALGIGPSSGRRAGSG